MSARKRYMACFLPYTPEEQIRAVDRPEEADALHDSMGCFVVRDDVTGETAGDCGHLHPEVPSVAGGFLPVDRRER